MTTGSVQRVEPAGSTPIGAGTQPKYWPPLAGYSGEKRVPSGYSGTPLPKKLGIKQGHRVMLVSAPGGFESVLGELPETVDLSRLELPLPGNDDSAPPDILVLFTRSVAELIHGIENSGRNMSPTSAIWIAWPKRASGIETDMTEDRVREIALPRGLVDNKVCAIDETWSGLRLVVRKENRADWPAAFDR